MGNAYLAKACDGLRYQGQIVTRSAIVELFRIAGKEGREYAGYKSLSAAYIM